MGDPEELQIKVAREIAAGGVLVAAVVSGCLTVTVLTVKFGESCSGGGDVEPVLVTQRLSRKASSSPGGATDHSPGL